MNILLVNDDGYRAEGIITLEKVLIGKGHNVYVLAPTLEQSGKSHSMTISGSRYATKYGEGHYHIDGTPADCIIYGLKSGLLGIEPDVVISGINHGYNQSTDIIYSGTCGAARQAAFYGYKAIAISTYRDKSNKYDFVGCAEFLSEHMEEFLSRLEASSQLLCSPQPLHTPESICTPESSHILQSPHTSQSLHTLQSSCTPQVPKGRAFVNINIPPNFNGRFRYASIGEISYDDRFSIEEEEDKRYKITNIGCVMDYKTIDNTHPNDFELTASGYASVSLVDLLPSCLDEHLES